MIENVQAQRPYRHFKGKLYYVHQISEDVETAETLITYQALYPPYKTYIRSLLAFSEQIDVKREDNLMKQNYRFELYTGESLKGENE